MKLIKLKIKDCLDCPYYEKLKGVGVTYYFCNRYDNSSSDTFRDLFEKCRLPDIEDDYYG